MSNIIYKYPKTSTFIGNKEKEVKFSSNIPHESTGNSHIDNYNRELLKSDIIPTYANTSTNINKNPRDLAKGFTKYGKHYWKKDARLRNGVTGDLIMLDRIPNSSHRTADEVAHDTGINGYGSGYDGYHDVHGDIDYYTNNEQIDTHKSTLFPMSGQIEMSVFKDPMGNFKPEYKKLYKTVPKGCNHEDPNEGCLTWIHDSTLHREEILERQMAKRNQMEWGSRWLQN